MMDVYKENHAQHEKPMPALRQTTAKGRKVREKAVSQDFSLLHGLCGKAGV